MSVRASADGPVFLPDPGEGHWLLDRWGTDSNRVSGLMPSGFEACVLAPHQWAGGRPWTEAMPTLEPPFVESLGGHHMLSRLFPEENEDMPEEGSIPAVVAAALAPHLPGDRIIHAVWDGWGWEGGAKSLALIGDATLAEKLVFRWKAAALHRSENRRVARSRRVAAEQARLVGLPHRDYYLFTAPLGWNDGWVVTPEVELSGWQQAANIVWPEDRSWCLCCDIESSATLICCDDPTADAIVDDPALEAYRIVPDMAAPWV